MPEFRDNDGRNWQLHISTWQAELIRRDSSVDIYDIKSIGPAISDPATLARMLTHCVDLEDRKCTAKSFMSSIWGDVITEAQRAFMEALLRFFPNRSEREILRIAFENWRSESQQQSDGNVSSGAVPEFSK